MDQHTKDELASMHPLSYAIPRHNHEPQQMDASSQTYVDGVGEGDVDNHPRHKSIQDIQAHDMDVVVC